MTLNLSEIERALEARNMDDVRSIMRFRDLAESQAPAMIARIRELEGVGQEMAHRQEKLIEALHAAINSPKGVVPRVAEQFYDPRNHLKGAE